MLFCLESVSGWWFFASPLKNDGVRQLGWWTSIPNWMESHSKFHGEWWLIVVNIQSIYQTIHGSKPTSSVLFLNFSSPDSGIQPWASQRAMKKITRRFPIWNTAWLIGVDLWVIIIHKNPGLWYLFYIITYQSSFIIYHLYPQILESNYNKTTQTDAWIPLHLATNQPGYF